MPRKLDDWLNAYTHYTRHLEAPLSLHFWSGVFTIAGALRGKTWIDMGYWKWRPNFFIIYVAPPGVATKSTTIENGMELLREIEGIHFGPNSATWQAITAAFAESTEIVNLPSGEEYEMSAITLPVSELGTFFDPRNSEMVDVLVDLWDGRPVPWKRRTQGEGEIPIPNPWINIIGATTPSWVEEHFPEYAIGGGFTSRTLFVFADHKRHFVAYPQDLLKADDLHTKSDLIHDLRIIANLKGPFRLSPEAKAWGKEWYENHWSEGISSSDRKAGYLSRKQTHIHKVAMVISAARRSTMEIFVEDMELANSLVTSLEDDMERVFERVTGSTQSRYLATVLQHVRRAGKIDRQELWRTCMTSMGLEEFKQTIDGLIQAGVIVQKQKGSQLLIYFQDIGQSSPHTTDDSASGPATGSQHSA